MKKKSWDKKWYSDEFLQELKNTAKVQMDGGLAITEKYATDAISNIGIDPRLLGGPLGKNAKMMSLLPNFILNKIKLTVNDKSLASFRESCNHISSAICVREGIDIEDTTVLAKDGYQIPIRIYRNDKCSDGCPCVYFMHGGAFIGGSIPPYDEAWKVFVEKFNMVVVSVDYRLLPENPYPIPFEDCFSVLEWIYNNSDKLHINKSHIFVTGDSAGGNLAQYCSTRAKGSNMVCGQMLLYATLNPFRIEDKYYKLGTQNFTYEPKQKRLSQCVTKQLEMMVDSFENATGISKADDYCNPYTSNPAGNPPTFISVGALDYLKIDCLAWAHKLQEAGVPVKVVVYNGMGHGYLSAMGVFPQAEDVVDEMGKFIQELI